MPKPVVITPPIAKRISRLAKKFSPKQIKEKLGDISYYTIYSHMAKRNLILVKSKPGSPAKPGSKPRQRRTKEPGAAEGYFNWRDFADFY